MKSVPLVILGASAGGLDAFELFFKHFDSFDDAAILLIQHFSPDSISMLPELLERRWGLRGVQTVNDGTTFKKGGIYVPRNSEGVRVKNGKLRTYTLSPETLRRRPIDQCVQSLVEGNVSNTYLLILSGTGSDGSTVLADYLHAGGVCFVQDPQEAKFQGMPEAALATRSPQIIKGGLSRICEEISSYLKADGEIRSQSLEDKQVLELKAILEEDGISTQAYDPAYFLERVLQRMRLLRIGSLGTYLDYLRKHPEEPGKVTSFLGYVGHSNLNEDLLTKETLEILASEMRSWDDVMEMRAWMPNFGGVESAVSFLISLEKLVNQVPRNWSVKIFATDSNPLVIDHARVAQFDKSHLNMLTGDSVSRYLTQEGNRFSLNGEARRNFTFTSHNWLVNPPYSGMSLIMLPNQISRYEAKTQELIWEALHFSLRENGFLILSPDETRLGSIKNYFSEIKSGVFKPRKDRIKKLTHSYQSAQIDKRPPSDTTASESVPQNLSLRNRASLALAADFVVFDESMDVHYLSGNARNLMRLKPGAAHLNLRRLMDTESQAAALSMFQALRESEETQVREVLLDKTIFMFRMNRLVEEPFYVLEFQVIHREVTDAEVQEQSHLAQSLEDANNYIAHLEDELADALTRFSVMNEEMQASNEELQSANEELETSAEELTSLNEELSFTNLELEHKVGELALAREEAEKANLAKTRFLASMSHELRTPLNVIVGLAQELEDSDMEAEHKKLFQTMRRASDSLMGMINDVLDLSKIDAGQMELYETQTALPQLCNEVMDLFTFKARPKKVKLKFLCDDSLHKPVLLDAQRFKQILMNLLGNAIKFTDKGEVAVQLTQPSPGRFTLVVKDSGRGMSSDFMKDMFSPYTQEREEDRSRHGGSGLGLSIVWSLIQTMGGSIDVDSEPGVGTEFQVNFPLRYYSSKAESLSIENPMDWKQRGKLKSFHKPLRVLIVDDSFDNRMLLRTFLKRSGYELFEAQSGLEALECYQEHRPDVVLMDLVMPEMDGYEATQALRKYELQADAEPGVIVAVTAHALKEVEDRVRESGFDHYMTKPVSKPNLLNFFKELLQSS